MLDSKSTSIVIPSPPYPQCSSKTGNGICTGIFLPICSPTMTIYNKEDTVIPGTIELKWQCTHCGRTVGC